MNTITKEGHTYEIVTHVPAGYEIWNIGDHAPEGYLPLCQVKPGTYEIIPETLKAIKCDNARDIIQCSVRGQGTIKAMERYIKRFAHAEPGSIAYRQIQRINKVLPTMHEIFD